MKRWCLEKNKYEREGSETVQFWKENQNNGKLEKHNSEQGQFRKGTIFQNKTNSSEQGNNNDKQKLKRKHLKHNDSGQEESGQVQF